MVAGKFTRRRAAAALLVAAALGVGWAAYRASLDPWPARAALRGEWPLAFTPDGRAFVSSIPGRITVRDWATGDVRSSWALPVTQFGAVGAYSPDGRTLAVGLGRGREPAGLMLIDVANGRVRATGTAHYPYVNVGGFGFTPDGASVLVASSDASGLREVTSFDAATGAVRFTCPPALPAGTGRVATSADGRFLVYCAVNGGPISIQEVGPAATRPPPEATGLASSGDFAAVSLAPGGRTLAVGRLDGSIDLWDVPGRRMIRTLPAPGDGHALEIAFAPDGRSIAAQYQDGPASWPNRLVAAANRLIGRPVTGARRFKLVVFDRATARCLARTPSAIWLYYSRDGRTVATHEPGNRLVELRDVPPD